MESTGVYWVPMFEVLEKAVMLMNVQLDNVLSDIMGKTGQLIVRAIVAGGWDGTVLAESRERAVRERLRGMLGVDLTAMPTIGVETALTRST